MKKLKSALVRSLSPASVVKLRALDMQLHSRTECRLIAKLCNPQKRSIDIGANLGVLTYMFSRYSSHTYAYEPNPELAATLRRAFKSNVTVVEAALSDEPGSTTLSIPYYDGVEAHGLGSIAQNFSDAQRVRRFSVPVRRLDDENLTDIGFVKIDVEQNEERVLRGGMKLFASQKPSIFLEVTPKLYAKPLQEFLRDLLSLGYRAYFLFDGQVLPLDAYRADIHNDANNYGKKGQYVTNIVLSMSSLS